MIKHSKNTSNSCYWGNQHALTFYYFCDCSIEIYKAAQNFLMQIALSLKAKHTSKMLILCLKVINLPSIITYLLLKKQSSLNCTGTYINSNLKMGQLGNVIRNPWYLFPVTPVLCSQAETTCCFQMLWK